MRRILGGFEPRIAPLNGLGKGDRAHGEAAHGT
jgi:hypothetical protein